jgi:dinuclear metal center YbgI/SA1388 family protein
MAYIVKDVVKVIERRFPLTYAESWDNCGLFCGDEKMAVKKILVALDPTLEVIESAIRQKVDMIITHHPLTISKLSKVNTQSIEGRKIEQLIKNDIALYSAHTSLDVEGMINKELSRLFGLNNPELLMPTASESLYKIVVFVPITHLETVRTAMCQAGAGNIGNYADCTFYTKGTGTFLPKEGTNPFIGAQGLLETVDEMRLETIVGKDCLYKVLRAMEKAHPYEEVAYDVYETERTMNKVGFGEIGELNEVLTGNEFVHHVKEALNLPHISFAGKKNKKIKKVAVCSGSGLSFLTEAIKKGADAYVTGDLKYHDAILAKESDILVIDATHFQTENIIVALLGNYLENKLKESIVILDDIHKNPIEII